MINDLSMWGLFLHASPLVKGVMITLLLASIASWAVIYQRQKFIKSAKQKLTDFEDRFWAGTDPKILFDALGVRQKALGGLERIFFAGFQEFAHLREDKGKGANIDDDTLLQCAGRAMYVAQSKEIDKLESNLPFLATVGSISPYVGLFGTVWGIMQSFIALGSVQQATLAMVAPGIAEALIATAMGLFAAIPAVVAYNRFVASSEKIANAYENFSEEVLSLLRRYSYTLSPAK